jgi:hypothetical protein
VRVGHEPALLLQAPEFPAGGVHAGHLVIVWNHGGNGYLASEHFAGRDAPGARHSALAVANELLTASQRR